MDKVGKGHGCKEDQEVPMDQWDMMNGQEDFSRGREEAAGGKATVNRSLQVESTRYV